MQILMLLMVGIAAGMAVAAGLFTFLVITGVTQRLMALTHTAGNVRQYEWLLIVGGVLGNALWLVVPSIPPAWIGQTASRAMLWVCGLLIGLFVGCLVGAVAEVLNGFPVFMRRVGLKKGIALIVISLAVGKAVGVWLWYFV